MVLYPGWAQLVPGAAARGAEFDTHNLLWILPWPAAPAWGTASNPTVARPTRAARIRDHLFMLTPFARVDACRPPEFPPTAPHHARTHVHARSWCSGVHLTRRNCRSHRQL